MTARNDASACRQHAPPVATRASPRLRAPLLAAAFLSLAGCSPPDYSPIRSWASTASLVADTPTLPTRPATAQAAATVAGLPPADRRALAADAVLAMQEALSLYLSALGTLATDGVLPYREDPLAAQARRAAEVSEGGAQAVSALGALLRRATRSNMQAPQLAEVIVAADPTVQALIAALSAQVTQQTLIEAEERRGAAAHYADLQQQSRDPAVLQALHDSAARRDQELAARATAQTQYGIALIGIADGHALLRTRARRLGQEETARLVRAEEERLRRAAALIPTRLVAGPASWAVCIG